MEFTRKELRQFFDRVLANSGRQYESLAESLNKELDVLFPVYKKGEEPVTEKPVGTLNKRLEFKNDGGKAEIGDTVYDIGDKYRVKFIQSTGKSVDVDYYKDTLHPAIKFN